jgi:predicted transcriptional regulator
MKAKVQSKLGEILQARGLRQKWVAEQIGASESQVSNWSKNDHNGVAVSTPNTLYMVRLEKLLSLRTGDMFIDLDEIKK